MKASIRLEHELLAVEREHEVNAMLELTAPGAPAGAARPPLSHRARHRPLRLDGRPQARRRQGVRRVPRPPPGARRPARGRDVRRRRAADRPARARSTGRPRSPRSPASPAGGQTNLSGGWLQGLEQLRGAPADGPRKILLLSDGLANVGITGGAELAALAGSAAANGVGTTTIGFGDGFDEELMSAMADAGGGRAYYAASPEEAPGIFAEEFEGLLALVAQNVSVEIRPSGAVEMLGVLNDHPAVTTVAGGIQVQLGDAFADETRRVVFTLRVPNLATLGVAKVADLVAAVRDRSATRSACTRSPSRSW